MGEPQNYHVEWTQNVTKGCMWHVPVYVMFYNIKTILYIVYGYTKYSRSDKSCRAVILLQQMVSSGKEGKGMRFYNILLL